MAGRDDVIERASVAIDRIRDGRHARSLVFSGLRGVGKTVLLQRLRVKAESQGMAPVDGEASEGRSLPAMLSLALRAALIRMSRGEAAKQTSKNALGVLANFVRAAKVKFHDTEFILDFSAEAGIADSGDLESDLTDLFLCVGHVAREQRTAVVLFIEELQYIKEQQLAALITALHHASQKQLPITIVAAGLPQLLGQMGRAKSYAERLFEFVEIGPLDDASAQRALCLPAKHEGVEITPDAISAIIQQTQGYPYFLQEWGKHAWDMASQSPIVRKDVERATESAISDLDASFFRVRFDRLAPAEKRYARAMAELGPGLHRTGEIARMLGEKNTTVAPIRARLIAKGMAYGPSHGDTAFTVPLFDGFLRRIMPDFEESVDLTHVDGQCE